MVQNLIIYSFFFKYYLGAIAIAAIIPYLSVEIVFKGTKTPIENESYSIDPLDLQPGVDDIRVLLERCAGCSNRYGHSLLVVYANTENFWKEMQNADKLSGVANDFREHLISMPEDKRKRLIKINFWSTVRQISLPPKESVPRYIPI